jgi:helix-turn-helix protein
MPRRAIWRGIRCHLSYEIAELAAKCGVSRSTVRNWIKAGLPAMTDRKPILIYGAEFKHWRETTLDRRKQKCVPGEMYCFGCRLPRRPALGMVEFHADNEVRGRLVALCETCERPMFRACSHSKISQAMPGISVSISECGADTKSSD